MPAAATSGATLWSANRDLIIGRALRLCGAIGQGETASAAAVTEAAEALNDLTKELQADGMPLWKIRTYTAFSYTATTTYNIGIGSTVNQTAPLKILQAFNRRTDVTPNQDSPIVIVPKMDYELLGIKQSTGRPNQLYYNPPGAGIITVSDLKGVITVFPKPDTYTIANVTCVIIGQVPFDDYAAAGDVPDFPSYWYNTIKWGLAAELAYEYGVPYSERAMIMKQYLYHKNEALSFGTEEGSLQITPGPLWAHEGKA